jgi:hypothetical protein
MNDRVVCRVGMALVLGAGLLTLSQSARAQEVAVVGTAPVEEPKPREPLYLGLDFMLGYGNYTSVLQQDPNTPSGLYSYALDTTQIRTATFTLMAHYQMRKIGFGFRLPLISGHISGDPALQATGNDVFNSGNAEFSVDMPKRVSETMKLLSSFALTLPTSPGDATPYSQTVLDNQMAAKAQSNGDQTQQQTLGDAYARYAIGVAAAFARGGEDDALFFNWRLGFTPKVELKMKFGHSRVEPYVKIPIMIGLEQSSASEEPLRIEAVGGVRFVQEIGPLHLGVRLVGMVPIAAARAPGAYGDPMLSIWPEIRLQVTPSAQFWVAGMIPLAGDYSVFTTNPAPENAAFNAGISATF